MKLVILADEIQRAAFSPAHDDSAALVWVNEIEEFQKNADADVFVDLLFENGDYRINTLRQLKPRLVIINSVIDTLNETDSDFVRINGWNSFLDKDLIEAAANEKNHELSVQALALLGKTLVWVPDQPGFVSPRVVAMIINEASLLLQEGGSTKEDIDLAMKLGTNYPYGPFEWEEKIGAEGVKALVGREREKEKEKQKQKQ